VSRTHTWMVTQRCDADADLQHQQQVDADDRRTSLQRLPLSPPHIDRCSDPDPLRLLSLSLEGAAPGLDHCAPCCVGRRSLQVRSFQSTAGRVAVLYRMPSAATTERGASSAGGGVAHRRRVRRQSSTGVDARPSSGSDVE
jgi:hypothetical protein